MKRHKRIPLFIDKVERIREISIESWRNVEVKRFETGKVNQLEHFSFTSHLFNDNGFAGLKLKELAHLRRNHAEELFKHIFPIVPDHTVVKDSTQLVRSFS